MYQITNHLISILEIKGSALNEPAKRPDMEKILECMDVEIHME